MATAPLDALQHLVVALNSAGDAAELAQACASQIHVDRMGFHHERDCVVEVLTGLPQVQQWLARTAPVVQFAIDIRTFQLNGQGAWQVRYVVTAPDDFVGGGLWQLQCDTAGLITYLRHTPDDLALEHWGPAPGQGRDHDHSAH
jgi:hypothetical protein